MAGRKRTTDSDVVQTTIRLRVRDWEHLSVLAIRERTSVQALAIEALNLLFKERGGLPEVKSPQTKK